MRNSKIIILVILLFAVLFSGCLKDYLDKSPNSGILDQDVFVKYTNLRSYFYRVYDGKNGTNDYNIRLTYPLNFVRWGNNFTLETTTDLSSASKNKKNDLVFKQGSCSMINDFVNNAGQRPILEAMFSVIRICNTTLANINLLKDGTANDKNDMIAQAFFVRGYAHFEVVKFWGGMVYVTKVLGVDDNWNIPRLTPHETLLRVAADMDSSVVYFKKANRMRRDPITAIENNPNKDFPDIDKPNGVAAVAFKARVLLYAASPLNNELGQQDWTNAAKANLEALQVAKQYGYGLVSKANYKTNYVGTYTNEAIWSYYAGGLGNQTLGSLINPIITDNSSASPECPTQNAVDRFETILGDPLNTDNDRAAAVQNGHYKEQDPYANRDPRLSIDIMYNTGYCPGYGTPLNTAPIYTTNNGTVNSDLLNIGKYPGVTNTGYYNAKRWNGGTNKAAIGGDYTDPLIRVAELYLNYAEAANEVSGPKTAVAGANITAEEAINIVRTRVGMPNVLAAFTGNKDDFRKRIKNERVVELCFEGSHYFFDIRRWKDAPALMGGGNLVKMDIEKVAVSAQYPTGYMYTRNLLESVYQSTWKDEMYYLPFPISYTYVMKNFVFNKYW